MAGVGSPSGDLPVNPSSLRLYLARTSFLETEICRMIVCSVRRMISLGSRITVTFLHFFTSRRCWREPRSFFSDFRARTHRAVVRHLWATRATSLWFLRSVPRSIVFAVWDLEGPQRVMLDWVRLTLHPQQWKGPVNGLKEGLCFGRRDNVQTAPSNWLGGASGIRCTRTIFSRRSSSR